jgi:hypothetical protein
MEKAKLVQSIRELSQTIANQAQAIADQKMSTDQEVIAQAALIANNAVTLKVWAELAQE